MLSIWISFTLPSSSDIIVANFISPLHNVQRPCWPPKMSPSKGKRWHECAGRGKITGKLWDQDDHHGTQPPYNQSLSLGNRAKSMDFKEDNGIAVCGLMVGFLQEWGTALEKGAGMCDWKFNEQVMKASIMGWLEAGTLISFDTDCKKSGEESVKALESEEKWFGGVEREGCKIHGQYSHSDIFSSYNWATWHLSKIEEKWCRWNEIKAGTWTQVLFKPVDRKGHCIKYYTRPRQNVDVRLAELPESKRCLDERHLW